MAHKCPEIVSTYLNKSGQIFAFGALAVVIEV